MRADTSFEARLQAAAPKLARYLAGTVRDTHTRDDILQETLRRAITHQTELRTPAHLLAWLKQIARHLLSDQSRLRQREKTLDEIEPRCAPENPGNGNVLEMIENFAPLLMPYLADWEYIITLTLHFCLDWDADQIAKTLGRKTDTILRQISSSRERLREDAPKPHGKQIAHLQSFIVNMLLQEAARPTRGPGFRNAALLTECLSLARQMTAAYPDDSYVTIHATAIFYYAGRVAEYSADLEPPRPLWRWRRERWNWRFIEEAATLSRNLDAPETPELYRLMATMYRGVHQPRRAVDIDWPSQVNIAQRILTLHPRHQLAFVNWAYAEHALRGPAAAVRVLTEHQSNAELRDFAPLHCLLGDLYMEAGQWDRAARSYRKFRKQTRNPAEQNFTRDQIAVCRAKARTDTL